MVTIEVIQVDFYDGTKYVVRTDRKDCHEKLRALTLEKRAILEAMPMKKRTKVAKKSFKDIGGLSKRTLKNIDEQVKPAPNNR